MFIFPVVATPIVSTSLEHQAKIDFVEVKLYINQLNVFYPKGTSVRYIDCCKMFTTT